MKDKIIATLKGVFIGLLAIAAMLFAFSTGEDARQRHNIEVKTELCREILHEMCVGFSGCGFAPNHDTCIMTFRDTSICDDPDKMDLDKMKESLAQIKTLTCQDLKESTKPLPTLGSPGTDL